MVKVPKYAFVKGQEVVLAEIIPHAVASGVAAVVFKDAEGERRYVTEDEWAAGVSEFASFALDQHLSDSGFVVRVRENPLVGVAVFDGETAWYGTLPLLAFAKSDDCSLRIASAEVAADLEMALNRKGEEVTSR